MTTSSGRTAAVVAGALLAACTACAARTGGLAGDGPVVLPAGATDSEMPPAEEVPTGGGAPALADGSYLATAVLAGDGGASGQATVLVDVEAASVCAQIDSAVEGAGVPIEGAAAHLHREGEDAALLDLQPPRDGTGGSVCSDVDPDVVEALVDDPASFVVDVHVGEDRAPTLAGRLERASRS